MLYDIMTWWSQNMETFSLLLALCVRNSMNHISWDYIIMGLHHQWTAFHGITSWDYINIMHWLAHKGQWRRALMFFFICAWTNSWVNNCDTSDLRHRHTHYDITVMKTWVNTGSVNGLSPDPLGSHDLNWWSLVMNLNFKHKLQRNFNGNLNIFFWENTIKRPSAECRPSVKYHPLCSNLFVF